MDGSLHKESRIAGMWEVIRDATGGWAMGFTTRIAR